MSEKSYEVFEHTADIGLKIYGASVADLFLNAVKGLFHLIAPQLSVCEIAFPFPSPPKLIKIDLTAPSQEELLVYWLNEFIYYFFTKKLFPETLKIDILEQDSLVSEVSLKKCSQTCPIELEVKAATYHNLSIKKFGKIYQAEIIFDI